MQSKLKREDNLKIKAELEYSKSVSVSPAQVSAGLRGFFLLHHHPPLFIMSHLSSPCTLQRKKLYFLVSFLILLQFDLK